MRITERNLKPGDVLLYNGKTWIAWFIKHFDGRDVSHAGLYLGNGRVGEALFRGIVENPLSSSIQGCKWVKAVRHRASDDGDDMKPVLQKAKDVLSKGERYAFEQILLLALICSARKIDYENSSTLRKIAQYAIMGAENLLNRFRTEGREPMICSEFVYRSFDEAIPEEHDHYAIQIGTYKSVAEAPRRRRRFFRATSTTKEIPAFSAIEPGSLLDSPPVFSASILPIAAMPHENIAVELEDLIRQYHDEIEANQNDTFICGANASENDDISVDELAQSAQSFASLLIEQELVACSQSESSSSQQTTPDFVTPGDLLKSPTLREVGDLFP